ncbi:tetratricopeptide repeat protein [Streptomyces sp. NPDC059142]|uniref:tetratricopeptide repeat protein n=1 Tax=Streptomyces sp. NPDC059142 TaxID=3346739 RepID=UPI0036BF282B
MAQAQAESDRPSMAELIARRRRFVGRGAELAAFRENFGHPPEDERHRYLFHVHGNAGVGKTSLVRELERTARECGALTAYVDESAGSVPEALAAIAEQLGRQGHPLKQLDRQLATYRQRRHEAESATEPGADPAAASAGSTAVVTAGMIGLRMVPVVGPFADAVDPQHLAAGADRLRATLSARFRDQEDVQLVLRPDQVLTPVLVSELTGISRDIPWIALFFDTYERTAPFLDTWLRDLIKAGRYGDFPGRVVVTLAGQRPLDPACWGGYGEFATSLPLAPFTEGEARTLLAAKRVTDESVVEEVLRLSGGLPVLVSTLAENQPTDPDDVGDPSATAVERFLKWEQDPVRRSAALACALPRRLDEDVFRETVPEDAAGLYDWLRTLPFALGRDGGVAYHGVVRAPMLRLQRTRSPRNWRERHTALAATFARWRAETETELPADEVWESAEWRALRFEETYHRLCAAPRGALPGALRDVVEGCRESPPAAARRAARVLAEAGEDTGDGTARDWGRRLLAALDDDQHGVRDALGLLLDRAGLDTPGRAAAHRVRGAELREEGAYARSLAEYDRSLALDPDEPRAYFGRGLTHQADGDHDAALADLRRADELAPDTYWILEEYGEALRLAGRLDEAVELFDRVLVLDPTEAFALASRGVAHHALGRHDAALADLDRALELDDAYLWALVRRARLLRHMGEPDRAFADLDRAVELAPDSAWIASERGDAYRIGGRNEDAERELTRTLEIEADHASALAGRGYVRHRLGLHAEARADLDRAVELSPEYAWALAHRAALREEQDDATGALADLERAAEAEPGIVWIRRERGEARRAAGLHEEAVADLTAVLERRPDDDWALSLRGRSHRALGRHGDSLADLDRALEADPANPWHHYFRARTALATGRAEQAHAGFLRSAELNPDPAPADLARRAVANVSLLLGRPEEALRLLDGLTTDEDDDRLDRCEALRRTGRWAEALETAERCAAEKPVYGTVQRALTVTVAHGADAGAPVWRELERRIAETADPPEDMRAYGNALCSAARGDGEALDAAFAALRATEHEWDDLAQLASDLGELLEAPGTDTAVLSPRLAQVAAAADAFAARWA